MFSASKHHKQFNDTIHHNLSVRAVPVACQKSNSLYSKAEDSPKMVGCLMKPLLINSLQRSMIKWWHSKLAIWYIASVAMALSCKHTHQRPVLFRSSYVKLNNAAVGLDTSLFQEHLLPLHPTHTNDKKSHCILLFIQRTVHPNTDQEMRSKALANCCITNYSLFGVTKSKEILAELWEWIVITVTDSNTYSDSIARKLEA